MVLGTHHLISGGGGARLKWKKIVCRHKSQKKKFVENVSRKKKFVVEIYEKYVDQKKHQMVTYILGEAYDKNILRHNIKKNCRTLIVKKNLFSTGGKKKSLQATKTLAPPPPPAIKWCVP